MELVLVVVFGVAGVLARYGIDRAFVSWNVEFPGSTLFVNCVASFVAGSVYALGVHKNMSSSLQMILLVGFCGGFSTFSAYTLQSLTLIERGRPLVGLAYLVGSPLLGLLAALVPILLVRRIF